MPFRPSISTLNLLAGGLISYGPNFTDIWRRVGDYAGQILKGAKPADAAANSLRADDQPQDR
jgi:ABC-type uncharacterized transport system substrate-binding protein